MGTLTGRFPDDIARGAEGGHGHFSTIVTVGSGGFEVRSPMWEDARGRWNLARAIERTGQHEPARSWFYKARGMTHSWRMKDWHDFKASRTGSDKGRLTGSGTTWQINKVYGADDPSFEYVRPLHRIVSGTVQIWRNTTLQTLTTDYTVNNDTGVVTSATSWTGDTLEVACQFDVLCRFGIDTFSPGLIYRLSEAEMLHQWQNIDVVEVREEPA